MECGDIEAAALISVPMYSPSSGDWRQGEGAIGAFPVGNRTPPNKYVPFNWQILSELRQMAAKHGLGSPAVVNMLQFITSSELTPYDMKQIAKLLCTPLQYMVFESAWRSYAEERELQNSRASQQDPCFGAGVSQLMGLHPMHDPQTQARLNPLILAQAKDLAMRALTKIADMSVPTHSFSSVRQNPSKLYTQFIERLQDAVEKQIANSDTRSLLILRLARDNANEDCRKIIDALPKENLSLEDMINACAKVGTMSHSMDMLANAMAAAMKTFHKQTLRCYKCEQQGHMKVNPYHGAHFEDRGV